MLTGATRLPQAMLAEPEHEVGKRVRKATEILRDALARTQSRPALAEHRIREEIETYCRDPHGVFWVAFHTRYGRQPAYLKIPVRNTAAEREAIKHQQQLACQAEKALRAFQDALPGLRELFGDLHDQLRSIDWEYWIGYAKKLQQMPKLGWPKKDDTPARYHASAVAVRLFEAHGLNCRVSRSSPNHHPLVALARAIYGGEASKGWPDLLRQAIDESKRRKQEA